MLQLMGLQRVGHDFATEQQLFICMCVCIYIYIYMAFPVVMYRCESWTVKKTERQRIDAFELWCWRRLLRVP